MISAKGSPASTRQVHVNANGNERISFGHLIDKIFTRVLDQDLVAYDRNWIIQNDLQRQLEAKGYRLRWVSPPRVGASLREGW